MIKNCPAEHHLAPCLPAGSVPPGDDPRAVPPRAGKIAAAAAAAAVSFRVGGAVYGDSNYTGLMDARCVARFFLRGAGGEEGSFL